MGASIDLAVTKWEQKMIEFVEFIPVDTFSFDELTATDYRQMQKNPILYRGCYMDQPLANERADFYLPYYKEQAKQYIEEVLTTQNGAFATWMKAIVVAHGTDDLYVSEGVGEVTVYKGFVIRPKTIWTACEHANFNEDGKLLLMALDVMDWKYGLSLPNTQIYWEELQLYAVGENPDFDAKIQFDTTQYVPRLEQFLKTVQKQTDDDFFEERFERWQILLDCLKKGATFIYSV